MKRKIALLGILLAVIMVLTGCVYYGSDGYYEAPYGYGYFTYGPAPHYPYGYHRPPGHGRDWGRYHH